MPKDHQEYTCGQIKAFLKLAAGRKTASYGESHLGEMVLGWSCTVFGFTLDALVGFVFHWIFRR